MQEPLISIGMPVYNRPIGLRKALESIVNQTYENLEIIISDNNSPNPEVIKIINEFQKNDKRIKFYQQNENIGPTSNFRFVEEKATSAYFMWAADDDYFKSNNLIEALAKHIPTHILCFSDFILSNQQNSNFISNVYGNCITKNEYLFAWLNNGSGYPIYGMYNRKLMQESSLTFKFDTDLVYYNEGTMLHKLFLTGKVKFVPNVFIYYNQNSKRPSFFELCSSYLEYMHRTLNIFHMSELTYTERKNALNIIEKVYSNYLYNLFFHLSLREKKKIFSSMLKKKKILTVVVLEFQKIALKSFARKIGLGYIKKKFIN